MNGICNKDAADNIDENSFTSMPKLDVQCHIIDLVFYFRQNKYFDWCEPIPSSTRRTWY